VRGNKSSPLAAPLVTPAAATDLISFLKSLPDCRMRRGIRYPQWLMLLEASLAIYRFFAKGFAYLCHESNVLYEH